MTAARETTGENGAIDRLGSFACQGAVAWERGTAERGSIAAIRTALTEAFA